jgi:uncharacterized LabA/DUF88 family protein
MIDGWFMRKRIKKLRSFPYNGPEIRKYCKSHLRDTDSLYRIFYYDTPPLNAKGHNPISGDFVNFSKTEVAVEQNELLESIKKTPNFALRLGRTNWRNKNWVLKYDKLKALFRGEIQINEVKKWDIHPRIEQKAVDMKIGIDIALIATKKIADLLIIITGDADIVPALKLARREGMMVGLDPLRNPISPYLSEHVDFIESKIPA